MAAQHRFLIGASALSLILSAGTAGAQDLDLGVVVVTPNRTPTELAKTGSSVSVIDEEEIEEQSQPFVTDYLTLVPGVSVAPQGGPGQQTSFFIRGARGQYVKTLINGIAVSDVTGTTVQASYGQFLVGGINRIEVLKGSQSTLYGSDAIAGVVDMSSLGDVEQGTRHGLHVEGGSRGTAFAGYTLESGHERGQFAASLSGFRTDGFSAAAAGTEDDGYENVTGTFAGRFDVSEDLSFFASGLLIDGTTEFDDSFPPPDFELTDSDATTDYRQLAGRVGADFRLFDGRLSNTVSAQLSDISRESTDGFGTVSTFDGRRFKLDYLGSFDVSPGLTMNFGADWERQQAETSSGIDESIDMGGGWAEAIYSPIDPLTLTAGLRHDEHSTFGGHTTWRVTGSYEFVNTATRIHSSLGTGYRAPSLFELYAPFFGNETLQPETSLSFDIGVEQRFLDDRLVADATFFMLDIEDFIGFDPVTFQSIQTDGVVRTRGIELSLAYAAASWLDLRGAYTYTRATQPDGTREVRVPRHDIALEAVARPAEKWEVVATAKIALDTVDGFGASKEALDDYVLLNAKVSYKPNENTEFYLRGENLLDQDYQVVDGYNTAGIGVFAGFKATFGP